MDKLQYILTGAAAVVILISLTAVHWVFFLLVPIVLFYGWAWSIEEERARARVQRDPRERR